MTLTEHIQPLLDKRLPAMAFAVMALGMSDARAVDHLVPQNETRGFISEDYNRIVRLAFKGVFAGDIVARVVIANPLGAERAVGVRRNSRGVEIVVLVSPERLLGYAELDTERHEMTSGAGLKSFADFLDLKHDRAEDVAVNACTAAIDTQLADDIITIWQYMLTRTKPAELRAPTVPPDGQRIETVTVDGTTFTFSNRANERGNAYSPDATGDAFSLIEIAARMSEICDAQSGAARDKLRAAVDGFLDRYPNRLQAIP